MKPRASLHFLEACVFMSLGVTWAVPPTLENISRPLCDVEQYNCSIVQVHGKWFDSAKDIVCKFVLISVDDFDDVYSSDLNTPAPENGSQLNSFNLTSGSYVSQTEIVCLLYTSVMTNNSWLDTEHTAVVERFELYVSHDGANNWSNGLGLTVYNSSCLSCSQDHFCKVKENACVRHGTCYHDYQCYENITLSNNTSGHGVMYDPCYHYTLLSGDDRIVGYTLSSSNPDPICDQHFITEGDWYRFDEKDTGGVIPETCQPAFTCRTHTPIWMNGSHPTAKNPGPIPVQVCGNHGNEVDNNEDDVDCCEWSETISVKYCPAQHTEGRYYVYQLKAPPCESAYCNMIYCYDGEIRNIDDDVCEDVDECQTLVCDNGGTCQNYHGSFACVCPDKYSGKYCQLESNFSCLFTECVHGTCVPSDYVKTCDEYFDDCYTITYCECDQGYTGEHCETIYDSHCYDMNPCQNMATCLTTYSGYKCICLDNYFGQNCEFLSVAGKDPCEQHPCRNGTCISSGNGHGLACQCTAGFTGKYCDVDVTTTCDHNTCLHGGSCFDAADGYMCVCQNLYIGSNCEEWGGPVTTSDPCDSASCVHGYCTPDYYLGEGYLCTCDAGYTGKLCEEGHGVSCLSYPCQNGGSCIEHNGVGHRCLCPAGFEGSHCERDTRSCWQYPGCLNGGTCMDDPHGHYCWCNHGFYGDHCQFTNDTGCKLCNRQPCRNGGTCFMYADNTDYYCSCPYSNMGKNCEDFPDGVDPCDLVACGHGTCISSTGRDNYTCQCEPGYEGLLCDLLKQDDSTSTPPHVDCNSNPCTNGGVCRMSSGEYECLCWYYYTGANCESYIYNDNKSAIPSSDDPCRSSPCVHGYCTPDYPYRSSEGYFCTCDAGYTGMHCEEGNGVSCLHYPCQNGGSCILGGEACFCPSGFEGSHCERDIRVCWTYPRCFNGGSCYYEYGRRYCQCREGFYGDHCQYVNETRCNLCASQPCRNGGTCFMFADNSDYYCSCLYSNMGKACENSVVNVTADFITEDEIEKALVIALPTACGILVILIFAGVVYVMKRRNSKMVL